MKKLVNVSGISQSDLADKSGTQWAKISRLVALDVITPVARIGERLIFDPSAVEAVKAHLANTKAAVEDQFRPEWDALDRKGKSAFGGSFSAYVAFRKNESNFQGFSRDGTRTTAATARARIGGAA